ncbi:hypothetical protein DPMN_100774 [Dreissena polymorpha]|uniref:Uncharacterized protein n=1 Tax=Dreissena polymorpha TaxID=45954 RepID=A0A9D4LHX3_DREPO|nr:hypothetical protein DPMN_100774 [Dreissena polymorpha]
MCQVSVSSLSSHIHPLSPAADPGVYRPDPLHAVPDDVRDAHCHVPPAAGGGQSTRGRTPSPGTGTPQTVPASRYASG